MPGGILLDGFLGFHVPAGPRRTEAPSHVCHGKNKPRNRRKQKNVLLRGNTRRKPDPPSIEEWRAPPMPGTEEILRKACYNYKDDFVQGQHAEGPVFSRKQNATEWLLNMDFESNLDLWKYIDSMDEAELMRQRKKYDLKYHNDPMVLKRYLMEFCALQTLYQKQADRLMEKRILKANRRAETRGFRRARQEAARVRALQEKEKEPYAKRKMPEHFQAVDAGDLDAPIWLERDGANLEQMVVATEIDSDLSMDADIF